MNSILQSIKKLVTALCLVSLASCSGSDTGPSGKIMFWSSINPATVPNVYPFQITIDGVMVGLVITYLPGSPAPAPTCDDPGTLTKTVPVGRHTVSAKNIGTPKLTSSAYTFTLLEGECAVFPLYCSTETCV